MAVYALNMHKLFMWELNGHDIHRIALWHSAFHMYMFHIIGHNLLNSLHQQTYFFLIQGLYSGRLCRVESKHVIYYVLKCLWIFQFGWKTQALCISGTYCTSP